MFKEKYKSDNHLIIPDQALISSLAEKMKSYQESELYAESVGATVDHTQKKKPLHRIAAILGVLAASLSVLVISATVLPYTMGTGNRVKEAESTMQGTAFDSASPTESSPLNEECKPDKTSFILTANEVDSITILEISGSTEAKKELTVSRETKKELTDSSDITKLTDFFNTLYSSRDTFTLNDVGIEESTGDRIVATFVLKDGTQNVFTLFDSSYFKLNNDAWFLLDDQYASQYSQLISSLQE